MEDTLQWIKKLDRLLTLQNEVTIDFPYPSLELFFDYLESKEIYFFESAEEEHSFLGLGLELQLNLETINEFQKENPTKILFANFSFEWGIDNLSALKFFLPKFSLYLKNQKLTLTKNTNNILEFSNFFTKISKQPVKQVFSIKNFETPNFSEWSNQIESCHELFRSKHLEKIVLKRNQSLELQNKELPILLFNYFYKNNKNSFNNYFIFLQNNENDSFMSFTPEKLLSIKNEEVSSMSIASSVFEDIHKKTEREQIHELNHSSKLIFEHKIVSEKILETFLNFCSNVKIDQNKTLNLSYIKHQSAKIRGIKGPNFDWKKLLLELHPTPAVGGFPKENAKKEIFNIEKIKRKNYAAPIGIFNANFLELAVGIRCAQLTKDHVTQSLNVFGGCGIVNHSEPLSEWIETEKKMKPFLDYITILPYKTEFIQNENVIRQ